MGPSDFTKIGAEGVLNRFYSDDYIRAISEVYQGRDSRDIFL